MVPNKSVRMSTLVASRNRRGRNCTCLFSDLTVDDLVLERRTTTAPRVRRDPDWFVRQILELAG